MKPIRGTLMSRSLLKKPGYLPPSSSLALAKGHFQGHRLFQLPSSKGSARTHSYICIYSTDPPKFHEELL